MRLIMPAVVVASVIALCPGSAWAQAKAQPKQFGGLKLVDPQNPRGLETDISVRVDADRLILIDPVLKKEVKSLPYSSITGIDDTFSITPPLPAGTINRQSTGAASMPAYIDRKSTRLNSSHVRISYAVFCLKKKNYAVVGRIGAGRPRRRL